MTRSKKIFIGFTGRSIEQSQQIYKIGKSGYECWNLREFIIDEFIRTLKKKIPPINKNVINNYKADKKNSFFGISDDLFSKCSWGLLITDGPDDALTSSYAETIFLLNLYSKRFLYPLFYATDMGIIPIPKTETLVHVEHFQNQSGIFKSEKFIKFFKQMLAQAKYGVWQSDRVKRWDDEEWRLFVVALLFGGLKEYDNRKSSFGWQRESADMATILETLFTAGDTQNEEVGYRLKKRIAVLLSWKIPSIEKEITKLYSERSKFIHGSFFAKIAKDSRRDNGNLPVPDFVILYEQKEYVRLAFIAYLHLSMILRVGILKLKFSL
jgi:hypothetical protein